MLPEGPFAILLESKQALARTIAKSGATENKGNQNNLVQHPESVVLGIYIRWSSSTIAYYNVYGMNQEGRGGNHRLP